MEQKRRWCLAVKKMIIENFHKSIPDRAKQVVLGGDVDDEKCKLRAGAFTCISYITCIDWFTCASVFTFTGAFSCVS